MTPQKIRWLAVAVTLPALLGTTACSSDDGGGNGSPTGSGPSRSGPSGSGTPVSLKLLKFEPGTLRVKAGTTVTWTNGEAITHTVTSGEPIGIDKTTGLRTGQKPDGKFDAKLASTGDVFSYTFKTPGTYQYYCSIHQGMNAEVVVTK